MNKRYPKSYIPMITTILFLLSGCSAVVTSIVQNPYSRFSGSYKTVAIISNGSSCDSVSTTILFDGNLASSHFMDASSQVDLATSTLIFELERLGFVVVPETSDHDLLIEFQIGSIRYDELVGWIADQAFIKMRDAYTNQVIAQYQAKTNLITPTVENIIYELVSEIRKNY